MRTCIITQLKVAPIQELEEEPGIFKTEIQNNVSNVVLKTAETLVLLQLANLFGY